MAASLQSNGISVLICTYNGAARLMPTLKHLAQQVMVSDVPWEVVLVDNNSNDDTVGHSLAQWERCGSPTSLRVLRQPKPGKQFALEMAYDAASYEFMCIVDDDNWLDSEYLQRGYDLLRANPEIGVLGGKNVGAFEVTPPAWFSYFQSSYAVGVPVAYLPEGKQQLVTGEVVKGVLWGAGLFVRHAIWRKLQQLEFKSLFTGRQGSNQLTAGEDDELCFVARILGYKVWYDEELNCTHYMTAGRLTEQYLKRLCYAAPRAHSGLSAYNKAFSASSARYFSLMPWLKDWAYMLRWTLRDIISWRYLKSFFKPDLLTTIEVNQRIMTWYYYTIRFGTCRQKFQQVVNFRIRAQKSLRLPVG